MNSTDHTPEITLRIPGDWEHPGELLERLPSGYRMTPAELVLPDGTQIAFSPLFPDEQFPGIFASSCRRPLSDTTKQRLARYTVNVGLTGPGGSMDAARAMMRAASVIVDAGGLGVFIDNCALAHSGEDWLQMTEDGGPDAVSFAFTSIIQGEGKFYTMGMQVMGFPNLTMRSSGDREDADALVEIIRGICSGASVDVGHVFAEPGGQQFVIAEKIDDELDPQSPMHNPFGCYRLINVDRVAENN
ncbi:hypothetical protein [Rubinisphaera margarita]|uniref:hypothetical protein n=1 Tax=Rubinisphaera margarita TaxID=2909586 RepID=UPI001EE95665|nr:hypothetical protein [Rubinisphaera margarita]MCG6157524.1 hypothetical protein [Rubinisphaera margarita]